MYMYMYILIYIYMYTYTCIYIYGRWDHAPFPSMYMARAQSD